MNCGTTNKTIKFQPASSVLLKTCLIALIIIPQSLSSCAKEKRISKEIKKKRNIHQKREEETDDTLDEGIKIIQTVTLPQRLPALPTTQKSVWP